MQDENRTKGGEKRQARQEKRRRTREQIREDLSLPDAKEKEEKKGFFHEWRQVTRSLFSITEDTASHEEIRDRLILGGKITGTNMCVNLGLHVFAFQKCHIPKMSYLRK